jgi:ABC-type transporter Mla subunit MlaD
MGRTVTKDSEVADAIRASLISPNVSDSNWEPANVVDVIDDLAGAIRGAGERIGTGLQSIAEAVDRLAIAIGDRGAS